jgi:xylulokinase
VLGIPARAPIIGDEFRTLIACAPNQYLLESVIQCGSATVAWLHETFLHAAGARVGPAEMDRRCEDIPPGCDGLLVLPHWRGVRVPHNDPDARGVVVGWTDRHTAVHLHRAIMEGIAFEAVSLLERIRKKHGIRVNRLVVGGGGAVSDVWCQVLADVARMPCVRGATVESASLGAGILAAAHGTGKSLASVARGIRERERVFEPRPSFDDVYARLRRLHARLYPATKNTCHHLGRIERTGER